MPNGENEQFRATLPVFKASQGMTWTVFLQVYYYYMQGIPSILFERDRTVFILNPFLIKKKIEL